MRAGLIPLQSSQRSALICAIGPLTNCGLNPARDLMPHIWACIAGWGPAVFGPNVLETGAVYTAGPLIGAIAAALLYNLVLCPMHHAGAAKDEACGCPNKHMMEIENSIL